MSERRVTYTCVASPAELTVHPTDHGARLEVDDGAGSWAEVVLDRQGVRDLIGDLRYLLPIEPVKVGAAPIHIPGLL